MGQKNTNEFGMSSMIGVSLNGLPFPVFFDPHYPIQINRPPVTLATGEPGAGKTFMMLILAAQSSLFGKSTVIIDPKGDFIALKNLEKAGYLKDIKVWSIFEDTESKEVSAMNTGLLDPLKLRPKPEDNVTLTVELIKTLAGDLTPKQETILIPIVKDEVLKPNPSLENVLNLLKRSKDDEARGLGHKVDAPLSTSSARLLKSSVRQIDTDNKDSLKRNLNSGTIVVSLLGLTLPSANKKPENMSPEEKIGISVMRMLTQLILDVMIQQPASQRKTLFVDEAWAVFATESGRNMLDQVSLLGRSKNIATIIATQSPLHLERNKDEASLDTTISTRFAFRTSSLTDVKHISKAMRLPISSESGEDWAEPMKGLASGQCLMKDVNDNLAFVQIIPTRGWKRALETTPTPKAKGSN